MLPLAFSPKHRCAYVQPSVTIEHFDLWFPGFWPEVLDGCMDGEKDVLRQ